ncbi:MAG: FG-GAP-like repeat-containing protein [Blastocatellia bacterium]|nr:FG-GAP-like repeat-containing protein [Blastocatellia bacterium]
MNTHHASATFIFGLLLAFTLSSAVPPLGVPARAQVTDPCLTPSFTQATDSPVAVGGSPIRVAVADFDSDGFLDLATPNLSGSPGEVTIRFGDGTGTFPTRSDITFAGVTDHRGPVGIVSADFNGDNNPDLALLNRNLNHVRILLGDGNGGFTVGPPIAVGSFPLSIAVGNFNGDANLDLAVVNNNFTPTCTNPGSVTILLGNGSGGFSQAPGSPVTVGRGANSVAVGNFNADVNADLAVTNNCDNNVTILLGNGLGGFSPASGSPVNGGPNPFFVATGDFNRDNRTDLAVANNDAIRETDDGRVTILLGNGNGTFTPGTPVITPDPSSIAVDDLNRDGNPDLAISNAAFTFGVTVAFGNGNGTFGTPIRFPAGGNPFDVRTGDFNGDNAPDLVVVNQPSNNLSIYLNDCICDPANTPPDITGETITRQQGSPALASTIATVSDEESPAGDLIVTVTSAPAGISITNIINTDGNITALVAADCTAVPGQNLVELQVSDGCDTTTANLTVNVTENTPPSLGTYPPTTVLEGDSVTVTPSAPPSDNGTLVDLMVTVEPPGFTGTVDIDPNTGEVTISNAGPTGIFTGTGIVTDNCGATSSVTLTLTVNAPSAIVCPADIMIDNTPGACSGVAEFTATATGFPEPEITCTPPSGSVFPLGATMVNCTAANGVEPDASCSFLVTVNDAQPPVVVGPSAITVPNDAGQCSASVSFNVTASDDCDGAITPVCQIDGKAITSPHTFPVGTTTITCTAEDAAGNSAECSFTVTVNDNQSPSIACPSPITVNNTPGQCSASVSFNVTASDNCSGAITPVCKIGGTIITSPHIFSAGTTTVICTAEDAAGNQAGCSFTVTVLDTESPSILCPDNTTSVAVNPGDATAVVNYATPSVVAGTVGDNCAVASVVCNPPSGAAFPLGTTTVACTVTDTAGNTAQCSFTVSTFDVCIEDDADPGKAVLFISTGPLAGTYRICCGGQTTTGVGTIGNKNGVLNLTHFTTTRRVQAFLYMNQERGSASLQMPPGAFPCTISDSDTTNNACSCSPD